MSVLRRPKLATVGWGVLLVLAVTGAGYVRGRLSGLATPQHRSSTVEGATEGELVSEPVYRTRRRIHFPR